jgi:S1-C subfamily serine protease
MRRRRSAASIGLVTVLVGPLIVLGCGGGRRASAAYRGSVVQVRVDDGKLVPAVATGWVGPCGLVVTVAHVLDGQRRLSVVRADGRVLQADLVGRDDGSDLALLRARGLGAPRLALAGAAVGSLRIAVRTYDQAEVRSIQLRRRISISIDERSGTYRRSGLEFTPGLARGDSGAPILDGEGKVVGVAFATTDTVAYASASTEVSAVIARDAPSCRTG